MKAEKVLLLALFISTATVASASEPLVERRRVRSFGYHGVELQNGPLQRQLDEVREYYLRIPNDSLLKGFRQRAGLPAPGPELGGWYGTDTFHVFGQILSGLARLHAATGDEACKAKADALMDGWARCIEPDGYFYYSRKPNSPHYTYEKMVGGLVDMLVYAHNEEASTHLSRITDWAVKNLDRTNAHALTSMTGPSEWYTLSENLYRAYQATQDSKYRDFAELWEYHDYWGIFAQGGDIFAPRPDGRKTEQYHAYSHVNTLSGSAAAYLVKGERRYLETLIHAYDDLKARQWLATGCYGPDEKLLQAKAMREHVLRTHNTAETQCGSWAVFKMCKYLIELTGEARYGDWIERVLINGIGASIPMTGDGRVFYYSDYNPDGARKVNVSFPWSCCTGTRPMAVADYADLIYFHDGEGLYVNLYAASKVQWTQGRSQVTLTQTTRFPESDTTCFNVQTRGRATFALNLRKPDWLAGPMRISLNGRELSGNATNGWLRILHTWRDGDRIEVSLPSKFWANPLTPDHPWPAALMRGPVALAWQAAQDPSFSPASVMFGKDLIPSPGEPLTFHPTSDPAVLVRPFYALKEREPYYIYLDPGKTERLRRIAFWDVQYKGSWQESTGFRFSKEQGATARVEFEGVSIRWLGHKFDDAGQAEVKIDGERVAVVDQFGPGRNLPFEWKSSALKSGKHDLTLTILDSRNAASSDRFINVAGFEVESSSK